MNQQIEIYKTPRPASELLKSREYKGVLEEIGNAKDSPIAFIGHARLVTNGYEQFNRNNQPFIKHGIIGVHNGIIVNQDQLWQKYKGEKISELDSELIPEIINYYTAKGAGLPESVDNLFKDIYGMTTTALLFNNRHSVLLATNNGSLYFLKTHDEFIFASEYYILASLFDRIKTNGDFKLSEVKQLRPGNAVTINMESNTLNEFILGKGEHTESKSVAHQEYKILDLSVDRKVTLNHTNPFQIISKKIPQEFNKHFGECESHIATVKRCSKCLLPESFPFIHFDDEGVCNFCNNYKKKSFHGEEALFQLAEKYRRSDENKYDLILPFSGGRDSSYVLHYVKHVLDLNPLAYSYDWGMITDLARRNQARMCGKLGVEHILISADIRRKRENIRKNVVAWLKRPSLGTIPLFMAGDKQYFYYANQLLRSNSIDLSILGENYLETTNFKSGFCGVKPNMDKDNTYSLSTGGKLKMISFYGKEYILNPAYINSSVFDTLDAFKSYYVMKHKNINLFDYIPWDQELIENIIIGEYDWEIDPGTKTTWRIGDGTAAFYNYIYYTVAGFTENDTFRSNQIREGMIDRDTALHLVKEENMPRYDSLKWYCNTIGVDFEKTIRRINHIPKQYNS